jgi:ribonuclease E
MLINYMPGEECRIAIVNNGRLEEFYQERGSAESHVGNIHKGKVTNVEPSIQAAFVDFGIGRNGFLHVTDLHPMYFPGGDKAALEQVGSKTPHRERPPIQKALRKGQEVLVQVLKEGIGTKGPTLTSYLSIPGRFLVMMPHMEHHGISRKVEDEETRKEMRRILTELDPPKDFGFIVRTAGLGQTKTDLKRDLAYLQRLWKTIERRRKQSKGPGELYSESDLIIRTIRDVFSSDIERIVVDDLTAARRAHDFLSIANPRAKSKVVYYDDPVPLFHRYKIEEQIEHINSHTVPLPSGGSLVIEQTEALVAIDVNSGKSRDAQDAESNAYNTNVEAVDEICRQLRLRDLGGVVVNDLIDMRSRKHRRQIEQRMRNNLKSDRARTRTGSISQFGIIEMTRQRMRPSLKSSIYMDCPNCGAPGHVKTPESVVLDVMRRLQLAMHRADVARIELNISPDVAFHLLNQKRAMLVNLETRFGKSATVRVGSGTLDHVTIQAFDRYGNSLGTDLDITADRIAPETETTYRDLDDPALPSPEEEPTPPVDEAEAEQQAEAPVKTEVEQALEATKDTEPTQADEGGNSGKRRRRRGGRGRRKGGDKSAGGAAEAEKTGDEAASADTAGEADTPQPDQAEASPAGGAGDNGEGTGSGNGRRRRGRRRGGRRRRRKSEATGEGQTQSENEGENQGQGESAPEERDASSGADQADQPPTDNASAGRSKSGSGRRKKKTTKPTDNAPTAEQDQAPNDAPPNRDSKREQAQAEPATETAGGEPTANNGAADDAGDAKQKNAAPTADNKSTKKTSKKSTKKKSTKKRSTRKKAASTKAQQDASQMPQPASDPNAGGASSPTSASNEPAGYSNKLVNDGPEQTTPDDQERT